MSGDRTQQLVELLPSVHRVRDAEAGGALRALMNVVEAELRAIEEDIERSYDDWFIETCQDWVIPYIGDLLGIRGLAADLPAPFRQRAYVANALSYRRRKGTVPVLEQVAGDVTGWGARAVEFLQLVEWSQHPDHVRITPSSDDAGRDPPAVDAVGTAHVRDLDVMDRLDGPFDVTAHTADVRPIDESQGWHNVPNVGVFVWRLGPYTLRNVEPRRSDVHDWAFHFQPTGHPAPLWNAPRRRPRSTERVSEVDAPGPIRAMAFHADLEEHRRRWEGVDEDKEPRTTTYLGPDRSLRVVMDEDDVLPSKVACMDLPSWRRPPDGMIGIDVRRGRLVLAEDLESSDVRVDLTYGFSAGMGSGPYDRSATLTTPGDVELVIDVAEGTATGTLQAALQTWRDANRPRAAIRIHDSGTYGGLLPAIELPPHGELTVEVAGLHRPSIRLIGDLAVAAPDEGARLRLNGVLVEGTIEVSGRLELELEHTCIVPGRQLSDDGLPQNPDRDAIVAKDAAKGAEVHVRNSILGPIRLPATARRLIVEDSIVDAPPADGGRRVAIAANDDGTAYAPSTIVARSTILGEVHVDELSLATDAIFTEPIRARRRQTGCARFSHVPVGSRTPRRYKCQPDEGLAAYARSTGRASVQDVPEVERAATVSRLRPRLTSRRYGSPGYCQLSLSCAAEIREGGSNGAEMGAFNQLRQPQREAALRARVDEHLPFGLRAGTIHVT